MPEFIFTMQAVTKVHPPDKRVLENIHLAFYPGAKIGVIGANGSGKSSLLRIMAGVDKTFGGEAKPHPGTKIGYFAQDHTGAIKKGMTAVEWLHQFDPDAARQDIHGLLGQMLFSGEEGLKPTEALSGGETARLLFCRIMLQKPNVLVLDEPTNGMDLVSTTQILGLARELHERDNLTVIMVSHALNEVANYVERIALVVERGFRIGTVAEIMNEETLTQMYGIPVDVDEMHGHRIVVARRTAPEGMPIVKVGGRDA